VPLGPVLEAYAECGRCVSGIVAQGPDADFAGAAFIVVGEVCEEAEGMAGWALAQVADVSCF
jgi:hypothetical protein